YTVTATDSAGNTATARSSASKDSTTSVGITAVTNPITATTVRSVAITGTARAGAGLRLSVNSGRMSIVRTVTADSSGAWSLSGLDLSSLRDGVLTFAVSGTPTTGDRAVATISATKKTTTGV